MYQALKTGLLALLKGIAPETDVLFSTLEKSDAAELTDRVGAFFSVQIKPVERETVSINLYRDTLIIDIAYEDETKQNGIYHAMANKIDDQIRPHFSYGKWFATVQRTSIKIVDFVLHYTFTIDVIYEVTENQQDIDLMTSLETTVERSN